MRGMLSIVGEREQDRSRRGGWRRGWRLRSITKRQGDGAGPTFAVFVAVAMTVVGFYLPTPSREVSWGLAGCSVVAALAKPGERIRTAAFAFAIGILLLGLAAGIRWLTLPVSGAGG